MNPADHELVVHVAGQLALEADGDPCPLCARPTNHWDDLCDRCAVSIADLADTIGEPRARAERFVEVRRCASCGGVCEDQRAAHCDDCATRWGLR